MTNVVITWATEYYAMGIKELRTEGREVDQGWLGWPIKSRIGNERIFGPLDHGPAKLRGGKASWRST